MNNKKFSIMKTIWAVPRIKSELILVVILSVLTNLLLLTSPLYMLQIYDRVLTSRSIETLIMLSVLALFLLTCYGVLNYLRSRLMMSVSLQIDDIFNVRIFNAVFSTNSANNKSDAQFIRDLETVRAMLTGKPMLAIIDLPWAPLFLLVIFYMHISLGLVALAGMIISVLITVASEYATKERVRATHSNQTRSFRFLDDCIRNTDVIKSMGMLGSIRDKWIKSYSDTADSWEVSTKRVYAFADSTKTFRIILQSAMLGFGGYLVLSNEATAGVMVAASIILGKALGPIEQTIAVSRELISAVMSYKRIEMLLGIREKDETHIHLPSPSGDLTVNDLSIAVAVSKKYILHKISFKLNHGEMLVVLGPSGSGKTTLAKSIVGLLTPGSGEVRLDGAELRQWDSDQLGAHIGYMPQDVQLLDGTIADNISRFNAGNDEAIVQAAKTADCHQLILNFAEGYGTVIGGNGIQLSGGESQRIALARCFYNKPVLIVLDEPDSNLDVAGIQALHTSIANMKKEKTTFVVISHNQNILKIADKVLFIAEGRMVFFGTPKQFMEKMASQHQERRNGADLEQK